MVGQDQRGTCNRSPSDLANPHPDQRAENAMIETGNGPLQPQVEGDADQLQRQQRKRKGNKGQQDCYDADHEADFAECGASRAAVIRNATSDKKMRPRSDAATDGDRWGRMICDGGA
jgi:hypothetical protein